MAITPFGCTREYFGDRVEYARPDRPAEIHTAVLRGWVRGPDPGLADHVAAHFLWSDVARRTAEVYDQVAAESRERSNRDSRFEISNFKIKFL